MPQCIFCERECELCAYPEFCKHTCVDPDADDDDALFGSLRAGVGEATASRSAGAARAWPRLPPHDLRTRRLP